MISNDVDAASSSSDTIEVKLRRLRCYWNKISENLGQEQQLVGQVRNLFSITNDTNLQFLTNANVRKYCLLDVLFPEQLKKPNGKIKQTLPSDKSFRASKARIISLLHEFWDPRKECTEINSLLCLKDGYISQYIEIMTLFLRSRRHEEEMEVVHTIGNRLYKIF